MPEYELNYSEVMAEINSQYPVGSIGWSEFHGDDVFAQASVLESVGIRQVEAADGSIRYYTTAVPLRTTGSQVSSTNSNYQNASYGKNARSFNANGTATQTTVGGVKTTTFENGSKSVSTGTKVATVAGNVLFGVGMVSLAGHLGKAISDSFYDNSQWEMTPSEWSDLYNESDGLGKFLLNVLYGVDGQNGTMYMDEQALAQAYMMMRAMGMYDAGDNQSTYEIPPAQDAYRLDIYPQPLISQITSWMTATNTDGGSGGYFLKSSTPVIFCKVRASNTYGGILIALSRQPFLWTAGWHPSAEGAAINANPTNNSTSGTTLNGTSFYYAVRGYSQGEYAAGLYPINITTVPNINAGNGDVVQKIATIIFDGNTTSSAVPGAEDDSQATTYIDPSLVDGATRDEVLQQLQTNYPELFDGAIYQDVPQKDGTMKRQRYVPTPYVSPSNRPTTGSNHQNNPQVNPQTNTQTQLDDFIQTITKLLDSHDIPDTGTGDTPPTIVPVGSASSLWKIYNPTQAQVDAFGSWLWDSSFVEQIKKLFNDPMQAIIGIHKVFAAPSTGGTATIKVGYLDSQVSSAWVDNQYTTVDCGSVSLKEYFGNVFDYAPYTKIQLYLPFIGIVDLDVGDVMRATISVKYHVDVLTGACLADVKVNRDGAGGVLYQYAGSAIVTYPVSAGNYMGMLAGVLSVAGGVAGTILSGGALAPALIGGAVGASHLHTDVSHSGGFSGCAGAMGSKKPYLIVSRPQIAMADNYQHYTGIPANSRVTLGSCSGYAKVKSVYVNSITRATEEEKNMIEAELKAGVLV